MCVCVCVCVLCVCVCLTLRNIILKKIEQKHEDKCHPRLCLSTDRRDSVSAIISPFYTYMIHTHTHTHTHMDCDSKIIFVPSVFVSYVSSNGHSTATQCQGLDHGNQFVFLKKFLPFQRRKRRGAEEKKGSQKREEDSSEDEEL